MPTHYGGTLKPKSKPMMKPVMKPKKNLTDKQKSLMKEHKSHHTKKHMDMMTKLMKNGMSFKQAHEKTMKSIGK